MYVNKKNKIKYIKQIQENHGKKTLEKSRK